MAAVTSENAGGKAGIPGRRPTPGVGLALLFVFGAIASHAQIAKGPDAFGYTATNAAVSSFRDISQTGIRVLQNSEDGSASITPDFAVKVYGDAAQQICVGVNGVITIGGCNEDICPNDDPAAFAPSADLRTVAPFWGDLSFDDPSADAVYYETTGTAPDRQFIVQWNKALDTVSGQVITFQAIFSERTDAIAFQYLDFGSADPDAAFGASTFIGIRDAAGNTSGKQLKWSFNADVIRKGTSIQFSVPNANSCPLQLGAETASVTAAGGDQTVAVTVPASCPWTASTNSNWIAISSGVAGSGNGSVTYSVLANAQTSSRQAALAIGGLTLTVTQAGVPAPPPQPPSTEPELPRLAVAEPALQLTAQQGTTVRGTIHVTADSAVVFYATPQPDARFLTVLSVSGATPGTIEVQANTAGLAPGQYTGTLTVGSNQAGNSASVIVTLRVVPVTLALSEASLSLDLALDAAPAERTIALSSSGPALAFAVSKSAGSDFLTVTPSAGTTPATLKITVNPSGLAVGSYSSVITVTPAGSTARTIAVSVNITPAVVRKPSFEKRGFVNGASFAEGGVAPGGIVSIFGTNLAKAEEPAHAVPLPSALGGVTATVNGVTAPLFYVGPLQVNLQVPYETAPGPATVILTVDGVASAPVTVDVVPVGPGVFLLGENKKAAALDQNYKVIGPENPVKPGQAAFLYLTGLGELDKPLGTGLPAPLDSLYRVRGVVQATIGGQPAEVVFAGLAPGFVGLYQVNVVIPDVPAGDQEVVLSVDGVKTNPAILAIGSR